MYCNFSLELQRREDQVSTVYDNFVADTKIIFCYLGAPSKKTFRKFVSNFFRKISTAQKMKFSIKDFFSKCEQILSFLWIWSHLLKKSLMVNFIFVQCRFLPWTSLNSNGHYVIAMILENQARLVRYTRVLAIYEIMIINVNI